MQLLCSAKICLDHFMITIASHSFTLSIQRKILSVFIYIYLFMKLIHFVELNFKLTQYCMISWYYLVSWYFSWYSIVRHFYGIVTTLLASNIENDFCLGYCLLQQNLDCLHSSFSIIDPAAFLFVTVKLLWHSLHFIKRYRNKGDLTDWSLVLAGFHPWVLTTWAAPPGWTCQAALPLAGVSSSTTWVRMPTKASCGRCSVHSVLSPTSRSSVTLTPTNAKGLGLFPWQITKRPQWPSPAWTDTAWATESCKCRSKPASLTSKGTVFLCRKRVWKLIVVCSKDFSYCWLSA